MFCVHIYNKRNSLCIYSTYTVQEHHLIIIYCSLFCERVAFIFDIMVFLAHQYIGETKATATGDILLDQVADGVQESLFGDEKVLTTSTGVFNRLPLMISTILSPLTHIRNFFVFFSPKSIQHVFVLPVAVTCKIIPQTENISCESL